MHRFTKQQSYTEMSAPNLAVYLLHIQLPLLKEAFELCYNCFRLAKPEILQDKSMEQINMGCERLKELILEDEQQTRLILEMVIGSTIMLDKKGVTMSQKTCQSRHEQVIGLLAEIRDAIALSQKESVITPSVKLCYARLFDLEQDLLRYIFLLDKVLFPKILALKLVE